MRAEKGEVLRVLHWGAYRLSEDRVRPRYDDVWGWTWRMIDEAEEIALAGGDGS